MREKALNEKTKRKREKKIEDNWLLQVYTIHEYTCNSNSSVGRLGCPLVNAKASSRSRTSHVLQDIRQERKENKRKKKERCGLYITGLRRRLIKMFLTRKRGVEESNLLVYLVCPSYLFSQMVEKNECRGGIRHDRGRFHRSFSS